MEVASLLYLALDESYLAASEIDTVFNQIEKVAGQLAALNRSLIVTTSKTPFARGRKSGTLDSRRAPLE